MYRGNRIILHKSKAQQVEEFEKLPHERDSFTDLLISGSVLVNNDSSSYIPSEFSPDVLLTIETS